MGGHIGATPTWKHGVDMSKTQGFFTEYLPNKIATKPGMVDEVGAVIVFDIDGAGSWTVNLKDAPGVTEGLAGASDCTVSCSADTFDKVLDNPNSAMMMFATGKLKVSNMQIGMKLGKVMA
jgi:putative sterol carrier protein